MDPCQSQQDLVNALAVLQLQFAQVVTGIAAQQTQLMMLYQAALNAKGLVDQQLMVAQQALMQCRQQNP